MAVEQGTALAAHPAIDLDIEGFASMTGAVDMLEDDVAVVAAGHPQAPPQRREYRGAARSLLVLILPEKPVEMLVVTYLVFGDAARQYAQHGVWAGPRQGSVIARGPGFDDAARCHLQAA